MKNVKQKLKKVGAVLAGITLTGCTKTQMSDYVVISNHGNKIEYASRLNPNKKYVINYDNPTQIYYYTHIRPGDTITGDVNVLNRAVKTDRLGLEIRRVNNKKLNAFMESVRNRAIASR